MPQLLAQGPAPMQRWRRVIPVDHEVTLGRAAAWSVPWDDLISRRHALLCWEGERLRVDRVPEARNPVFFRGQRVSRCFVGTGEHFVIGRTTFSLVEEQAQLSLDAPRPLAEQSFSPGYLRQLKFQNADHRLEVLGQLPEIISEAASDQELCVRLVNLLLQGVPTATNAAIVSTRESAPPAEPARAAPSSGADPGGNSGGNAGPGIEILHWDRQALAAVNFHPSERLIRQALASGESTVHRWSAGGGPGEGVAATTAGTAEEAAAGEGGYTASDNIDWAFCTPVPGEAARGWALYLSGHATPPGLGLADASDLRDEVKFAELAASTLGSLRTLRSLERNTASLSQFFSPVVLEALRGQDPDQVLAPREVEVSVLFCDLRGFSRRAEEASSDLLGLLQRVSQALTVMTRHILEQGGVVGDFHGDAAMGFWGWPLPQADGVQRAARAALAIRRDFEAAALRTDHALADFRMGIGLATGTAVAGKLGSLDQVKVTVFGPVVNLASRLEGMTKQLRAPILVDETTARLLGAVESPDYRLRRVARVRPFGMATACDVSELLDPPGPHSPLSDDDLVAYQTALKCLQRGDWESAFQWLHQVPAHDRVKDFLTAIIVQNHREPPADWDGVIRLESK